MNRAKVNSLHIPTFILTIGLTMLMALPSVLHTANASKETGKGPGAETAISPASNSAGKALMQAPANSCTDVSFQQPAGSPRQPP